MGSGIYVIVLLVILNFSSESVSQSIIQLYPKSHHSNTAADPVTVAVDDLYCHSWKFSVETNDAGKWSTIPKRCVDYVQEYITGDQYRSDSEIVADYSLEYLKTVKLTGKDAWVFDIDETLLSNLPYYTVHGFGSDIFDEKSFSEWVALAEAPALPASLRLYRELEEMGITIIFLTGRDEYQRNATEKNLFYAGYTHWEKLFLRGPSDQGTLATTYKSEKRRELEDEGYTIHGCSGDQWSDLLGFSMGKRSFKLPNPMYYIA